MSQTSLKQKKKNEPGMRYSKESLDAEKRKDPDKNGARLSTQMRRAGYPNHSLRCCPMRCHHSCRRCLCAAEGTSPCRTIRIYIHMCLLWEQGRQITMIRGSQELPVPNTDSRGYIVRNQWSRTSRSPSTGAPSVDEPRSRNTVVKVQAPNSSATSRTSSASPSHHETSPPPPSSEKPSLQQTPQTRPNTQLDSQPPTPPEHEPSSKRTSKMYGGSEPWALRDTREPRDLQLRDYAHSCDSRELIPKTPREYTRPSPTEWKPYVQRRLQYGTSVDMDQECLSEIQQQQQQQQQLRRQQIEEDEIDEAYWASVSMLYEKIPSCARPRPPKPKHAITIAVSSRALFNMVDDRKIYEEEGLEKYMEYQLTNENVILTPGPAFRFVKALQHVNARLRDLYPEEQDLFDIVLMTNNHAQVGVRLINSVNHYGLLIDRFCLTGGKSPIGYLKAYLTNLYLSADSEKVQEAIKEGIASATMFAGAKDMAYCDTQLRVAFDGDAVLFSDESEHIAKDHGLDKFFQHETLFENKPLAQGPLKSFLEDLGKLQKKFYAKDERLLCPIRTYLVTARSAASSGARVLKTLRRWGLEIDEALFLAGAPKGPILVKIRPHIFFDDQMFHIESAQKFGTITAHVPYGIAQKRN
ncbi:cytosolic 5'-nucleotidase 1B isoform X4 [Peromyscus californicus insignis]|uniref:cytosolic 5'-nucleotidase 1B isoform X4 n=1 Tax=Peromyscus californicus insignis TaxID=564181 RepID=UPI0022A7CFBF|nr:cytosolic 5'-nucleotidase 1B isoform X4 [Peromyscus californicus insignis]